MPSAYERRPKLSKAQRMTSRGISTPVIAASTSLPKPDSAYSPVHALLAAYDQRVHLRQLLEPIRIRESLYGNFRVSDLGDLTVLKAIS